MHKNSIASKINKLVSKMEPGHVFTTQDVAGIGSRWAVDHALSRLAESKKIDRIGRGLYYLPKVSPLLGPLSPAPDRIAQALGRQTKSIVQPIGAAAANALGLSSQVPARAVYITNGKSRRRRVGSTLIELKHAGPKTLAGSGTKAGSVVHALRHLRKRGISETVLAQLNSQLSKRDRRDLRALIPSAPGWMHADLRLLAEHPGQASQLSEEN